MQIIKTITEMHAISDNIRISEKKIALVPTMGYLHSGHLSLVEKAKEYGDVVIVSLFVNPTQFAPNEDFAAYPRDFQRDSKLCEDAKVDYIFAPEPKSMYYSDYSTIVHVGLVSEKFEGKFRPTHFQGVASVVAKLFLAVKPHFAVFGQKDFQQTAVIKRMVRDLNFDVKIVISPTIREEDGLAKSSRNVYLSPELREKAVILYHTIEKAKEAIFAGEKRRKIINAIMHNSLRQVPEIKIDYASSANAENFDEPETFQKGDHIVLLLAVYLGKTRLIDNAIVTM